MSIQEEINRIEQNVANTYTALNEMGATMPEKQNSDNLASTARTVPQGGGGVVVQSDYTENNPTSAAYIKNRLFYDNSITSHFSSDETPNPASFDTIIGFSFFKVSDLTLDIDKLLGTNFTYKNGSSFVLSLTPTADNIAHQSEDGVTLYFTLENGGQFCYYVSYKAGDTTVNVMGMDVPITVPETGIYIAMDNATLYPQTTVDIVYEDIKKIDKKFLPDQDGIAVIDVVIDNIDVLADETIPLDEKTGLKLYDVATGGVPCFLRLNISGFRMLLSHMGLGVFAHTRAYVSDAQVLTLEYNHVTNRLDIYNQYIESSSASSTTYGLRRPTEPTLADIVEMLMQSAIERGLLASD